MSDREHYTERGECVSAKRVCVYVIYDRKRERATRRETNDICERNPFVKRVIFDWKSLISLIRLSRDAFECVIIQFVP